MSASGDIFSTSAPRYFSMEAGRPFLIDLASQLHKAAEGESKTTLSDMLIFLPTRRAVRALCDAFLQTSADSAATLLPRIKALGDIDEDEFVVFDGAAADEIDLPPAISSMQRRLVLAKMVAARSKLFDGQEKWAGALAAADELAKLLDSFYTEEIDAERLSTIVPEAHAKHWGQSLEFLSIVTEAWPAYLHETGLTDPSDRRAKLIDRQTKNWVKTPPQTPIIVAGTTGSTPSVARMMKVVAQLPKGCIVLPGLDLHSDAEVWDTTDEPHPQSGLKKLLGNLDLSRTDIAHWPTDKLDQKLNAPRTELLSVVLRPAQSSNGWHQWMQQTSSDDLGNALNGLTLVEADDEEFEASSIALKLRETAADPKKTAMLVTPDRGLARRVAMKMRRWDINVDDSGGVPFPNSPCGVYLRLTAQWLADISGPAALLALLRHPLFGGGLDEKTRRNSVNAIDHALRGIRPLPGLEGLAEKIRKAREAAGAEPILSALTRALDDAAPIGSKFGFRLQAHLKLAEKLCSTDQLTGAERLWRGEDGAAGAQTLSEIAPTASLIQHDDPADYPDIFSQLIAKTSVRRLAPAHPRIFILGPLEARLQSADVTILGGLNESVWPRDAAIDPFLSRPMRKELGLPSPEQRIGLSAHDFSQLASSKEVMLTRATRSGGAPTKPSRWIVRLKNILTSTETLTSIDKTSYFATLSKKLDQPEEYISSHPPAPRPPVEARPRELHVTRVERLLRDPYGIYASHILNLRKLDKLNELLGPRQLGSLMHKVFYEYAADAPKGSSIEKVEVLKGLVEKYADSFGLTSDHAIFWRDAIDNALLWFADWDAEQRNTGSPAILEEEGSWDFDIDGAPFTLKARADRIDLLHTGGVNIIDYKNGQPPTLKQQEKFSPQLPLTGLITINGGFAELGPQVVTGFDYVRLLKRTGDSRDHSGASGDEAAALIAEADKGLHELVTHFSDPLTAYPSQPRAEYADQYGDYDHLARRRERDIQGGDE